MGSKKTFFMTKKIGLIMLIGKKGKGYTDGKTVGL